VTAHRSIRRRTKGKRYRSERQARGSTRKMRRVVSQSLSTLGPGPLHPLSLPNSSASDQRISELTECKHKARLRLLTKSWNRVTVRGNVGTGDLFAAGTQSTNRPDNKVIDNARLAPFRRPSESKR
jgi:hypothetical protein